MGTWIWEDGGMRMGRRRCGDGKVAGIGWGYLGYREGEREDREEEVV